ncbi:MAG: hypothetical protein RMK49_15215 [Abditibacteriales bacterium]|nr:hypothetical protein [Abditibacteriales bacterium]
MKRFRKAWWFIAGMGVALMARAESQRLRVFINGTETSEVISQGGKTYVAVSALREAGAEVHTEGNRVLIRFDPPAGREQVDAIEGRRGEWIHNGTWRVRVTEVAPIPNPFGVGPGYTVTVEMRNLTNRTVSPFATGMDKFRLVDTKGNILAPTGRSIDRYYNDLPPAAGVTLKIEFGDPQNSLQELGEPDKLLILFREFGGQKPLKNFRFFLHEEKAKKDDSSSKGS